jgi:hypothetical protein
MTFDSLMIHQAYLGTYSSSQNSLDEWKRTWTYSDTSTDCRMQTVTAEQIKTLPGEFDNVRLIGYFESGTSVDVDNRVRYNSKDYIVRSKYTDSSGHHIKTLLSRL